MANSNLTSAKRTKNDEFYTQYHDIEKEVLAYIEFNPDVLRDKTLLLPCDDPRMEQLFQVFRAKLWGVRLEKTHQHQLRFQQQKIRFRLSTDAV